MLRFVIHILVTIIYNHPGNIISQFHNTTISIFIYVCGVYEINLLNYN
jgi:hypothetical protein